MNKEVIIEGKVLKVGRVKPYKYGWGYKDRFFVLLSTPEGEIKAMIDAYDEEGKPRERPFIGDVIKISTREIKDGWASVTDKRLYEIISHEGKEKWLEEKKEKERLKQEYISKYHEEVNRLEKAGMQELKRLIPVKSDKVLEKLSGVILYLDVYKEEEEGKGGWSAVWEYGYGATGGYPGTGLRAPNAPLWGEPKNIRKAVLEKGLEYGLLDYDDETGKYRLTEKGKRVADEIRSILRKYRQMDTELLKKYRDYVEYYRPSIWLPYYEDAYDRFMDATEKIDVLDRWRETDDTEVLCDTHMIDSYTLHSYRVFTGNLEQAVKKCLSFRGGKIISAFSPALSFEEGKEYKIPCICRKEDGELKCYCVRSEYDFEYDKDIEYKEVEI